MSIAFSTLLNARQYEACTSDARFLRIVAGAGTGKTRVLTYRIAFLIDEMQILPQRLVAITFTKKVAKEMTERVQKILVDAGVTLTRHPWISTFHSFCNMILRREIGLLPGFTSAFSIYDDSDTQDAYKRVFNDMGIAKEKDKVKGIISTISRLKSNALFPEEVTEADIGYGNDFTYQELVDAYTRYQNALRASNALDFDDLQLFTYKILKNYPDVRQRWQNHFDAYLVDEFQDTDPLQYSLLKLLIGPNTGLTVVGDPDQTIYSWRGADASIMTAQLKKDFPGLVTVTLDENYRSTQKILDIANKLIKNNTDRDIDKSLYSFDHREGDDVRFNVYPSRDMEANMVANTVLRLHSQGVRYSDIAIIYRSNYLSSSFEKSFASNQIPYSIYGGTKFYERAEVKDALAWLRILVNAKDDISFMRAFSHPSISLGDARMQLIVSAARKYNLSLFETVQQHLGDIGLPPSVQSYILRDLEAYNKAQLVCENFEIGQELSNGLQTYFEEVGFIDFVKKQDENEDKKSFNFSEKDARINNVNELLNQIQSYMEQDHFDADGKKIEKNSLEDFLISVAIQDSQENMDQSADRTTLMTAHVSKGLEFPYVFVCGMADGLFPNMHSLNSGSRKAIAEERRLFYVAITRAKKELYISYPGGVDYQMNPFLPSMFLKEIGFMVPAGSIYAAVRRPWDKGSSPSYNGGYPTHLKIYHSDKKYDPFKEQTLAINKPAKPKAPAAKKTEQYSVGDKVAHVSFGVGEIIAVEATTITVKFPEPFGTKILTKGHKSYRRV